MKEDPVSRKLIVVSLLAAFVLGIVFGAIGPRLRPRVALAPAPPPDSPEPTPDIAANDGDTAEAERAADAVEEGEVASGIVDLEDGLPDSIPGDGTSESQDGYPIKVKKRSGLFHVPGGLAYDRTIADLHFRTVEAAEAAGYRQSKA